jgi:hypothetical protein
MAILARLSLRVLVAVTCTSLLLAFAQLTVNTLLAYYVNIPPYTGAG